MKWTDPEDSEIENLGNLLDCIEQLNSDLTLDFRKLIELENSFWKGIRSIEEKGFLAFFREWNNEDLNYAEVCILKSLIKESLIKTSALSVHRIK